MLKYAHLCIVALIITLSFGGKALAAPGDIYAAIMASPASWNSPGHAFVCIAYHLNTGIKEECYGFYPSNRPGEIFIGAPALSNEFNKSPVRFSQISWTLKKKITEQQRRAFLDLVGRVNTGSYRLLSNNCGDFVHDAVGVFGWKNVSKGPLPEPYVQELFIANITSFRHPAGYFNRDGNMWREYQSGRNNATFVETGHDASWIVARDESRKLDLRFPIKGGFCQWRTTGGWQNLYNVTSIVD